MRELEKNKKQRQSVSSVRHRYPGQCGVGSVANTRTDIDSPSLSTFHAMKIIQIGISVREDSLNRYAYALMLMS